MRRYPDWLIVQIPGSGGSRNPSGQWVPNPGTTLYEGPVHAEDSGSVLSWSGGLPVLTSDAVCAIPPRRARDVIPKLKPRQPVKLRWGRDGKEQDAEIAKAMRTGSRVHLKYL